MKLKLTILTALSLFIVACGSADIATPEPSASSTDTDKTSSGETNPDTDEKNSEAKESASPEPEFSVESAKEKLIGCWAGEVSSIKFGTFKLPRGVDLSHFYYPNKANPNTYQPSSLYIEGPGAFILNKSSKTARSFTYEFQGDQLILTEKGVATTYSSCS